MDSDVKHALLELISANRDLIKTAQNEKPAHAVMRGAPSVESEPDIRIANGVLWFRSDGAVGIDGAYRSEPVMDVFLRPSCIRAVQVIDKLLTIWDTHAHKYNVVLSDGYSSHRVAAWIRAFAMGETGGAG